jgi:hypothetical protein
MKLDYTDYSFGIAQGCCKVFEGCEHCYAEEDAQGWPRRKDLPRANVALDRRINKRIKTATSYLSVGRVRQRYGR